MDYEERQRKERQEYWERRRKEQENLRGKIIEEMKLMGAQGCRCFIKNYNGHFPDHTHGFVVTPSDNVMYWEFEYFRGFRYSLQYIPENNHGTGCRALDEFPTFDLETVLKNEKECLRYAKKLRATLYPNSETWYKKYWDTENLTEVKAA